MNNSGKVSGEFWCSTGLSSTSPTDFGVAKFSIIFHYQMPVPRLHRSLASSSWLRNIANKTRQLLPLPQETQEYVAMVFALAPFTSFLVGVDRIDERHEKRKKLLHISKRRRYSTGSKRESLLATKRWQKQLL